MTTFEIKIASLELVDGQQETHRQGIVQSIAFDVIGTNEDITRTAHRKIGLAPAVSDSFVPLEQLTDEILIGFVCNAMTEDDMRIICADLQDAIDAAKSGTHSLTRHSWPSAAKVKT